MLKRIGAEESGELKAVASGTLPCGKPVIVNADGTVSVVDATSGGSAFGSPVVFNEAESIYESSAFDSNSNKVVISYRNSAIGDKGYAVVGTVSGSSISFGTPVIFNNGGTNYTSMNFDSNSNKIVIAYQDAGNSSYGKAVVGTVSGTSISFGSEVAFNSANTDNITSTFDSNSNKVVIAYRDQGNSGYGTAVVGTVSGTSISFGSEVVFNSSGTVYNGSTFDSNSNKVVIVYRDDGNSSRGTAIVGTVSGTSISFGSEVIFDSDRADGNVATFDSNSNKVVVAYQDPNNSDAAQAIVGTVSGTSISFGSAVVISTNAYIYFAASFDSNANKVLISYIDKGNSNYSTAVVGTVSGTSISFETPIVFSPSNSINAYPSSTFDSNSNAIVVSYRDAGNSNYGEAVVFRSQSTNLTSENYIGMSKGTAFQTGDAAAIGSAAVFESANTGKTAATFDSSNNKIVICYRDLGNSNHGTAVVGTVSGSAISFGTPVVFNAATTGDDLSVTFDSNSNKVVVVFDHSSQGKAIVGTVSGTSISFGSAATFDSSQGVNMDVAFDSNSNKVVVVYTGTNNYVESKVGTVSGTSISFGSAVVAKSSSTDGNAITFDSNRNKIVIVSRISTNAQAMVGTVSGTSISFASSVALGTQTKFLALTFDSSNNKVITAFVDGSSADEGKVIVGDINSSGVISFGTAVQYNANIEEQQGVAFDSNTNKVIVAYDSKGTSKGQVVSGTVSGTSISFDSETVFEAANVEGVSVAFDSNSNKSVISYIDADNSRYGTSAVFTPTTLATTRAEVASGQPARLDIIGSVSDNQIGLTAGQQYFVQTDGTIGETAADPSVLAGTAISATELVVKT